MRENGVVDDGILQRGIVGLYMPEFNLETPTDDYLLGEEWKGIIGKWEGHVRSVVERKGKPAEFF